MLATLKKSRNARAGGFAFFFHRLRRLQKPRPSQLPSALRPVLEKPPPTPPSAGLEIILQYGRSSYISGGALSRRSSRFKWNYRSHSLTYLQFNCWCFGVRGYVNILPWKLVNKLVCVMKVFLSIGLIVVDVIA